MDSQNARRPHKNVPVEYRIENSAFEYYCNKGNRWTNNRRRATKWSHGVAVRVAQQLAHEHGEDMLVTGPPLDGISSWTLSPDERESRTGDERGKP